MMKIKAYLIYKTIGTKYAFTLKKPNAADTIFDEVEIILPDSATLEKTESETPFIRGKGNMINEDLNTIIGNGVPHPAIVQMINRNPVNTILKYTKI